MARVLSGSNVADEQLNQLLLSGDEINPLMVDRLLSQKFIIESRQLSRTLPIYAQRFIKAFFEKVYIDALKLILRSKHVGLTKEETSQLLIIPDDRDPLVFERLLDLPGIPQVIEAITDPWIKQSLQEALPDYEQANSTLPLEQALNKDLFTRIWQKSSALSIPDKKGVFALLGSEADFINLMVILRCKILEIDSETTKRWLIPIRYRLSQETLDMLIQVSVPEFISRLNNSAYDELAEQARDMFKGTDKIHLAGFELLMKQFLAHKANTVLSASPFQLGVYFGWYTLAIRQVENVRAILVGKIAGLSDDIIRNEIVFF